MATTVYGHYTGQTVLEPNSTQPVSP